MPAPKLTKKQRSEAIRDIVDMITIGARYNQITTQIANKYDISVRSAERLMQKSNEEFDKVQERLFEKAVGQALAKLNFLYSRLVQDRDYKGAVQPLKEMNDILGIKVQKVESEQTIIYQSAVPEPDELPEEESADDEPLE